MEPGQLIDERYVVERALATGGMATVWVVRHRELDSLHALKILHLPSPDIRERLLLEGRLQAKLRHPHIVAVTDTLTVDGNPGLVMEYVDGPSLEDWLAQHRPTPDQLEHLFLGILAAVEHAHQHGVVHRDLKPANVLLAPMSGGVLPKVADFGIAKVVDDVLDAKARGHKHTRSGVMMGTPAYMAPEQATSASEVGVPADLFALGCILYEMALGLPAFDGPHLGAILHKVAECEFVDPHALDPTLPAGLVAAIRQTLVPDPAQRPASCTALAALLTDGRVTTLSGLSEAPTRIPPASKRTTPRPTGPGPTLLAGMAVGGAGMIGAGLLMTAAIIAVLVLSMQDDDPMVPPTPSSTDPAPEPQVVVAPTAPEPRPTIPEAQPPAPEPRPTIPEAQPTAPEPVVAPEPAVQPAPVVPEPVAVQPAPVVPEPVPTSDRWTIRVLDARRTDLTTKGSVLRYAAPDGYDLVLVDVSVTYGGDDAVEPMSPWQLATTKSTAEASARCGVAVPNSLSSLARYEPGASAAGTLCFEVPRGARARRLRFTSGRSGEASVEVGIP